MNKEKIKNIGIQVTVALAVIFCLKVYHYIKNKTESKNIVAYSNENKTQVQEKHLYLADEIKVSGNTKEEQIDSFCNNFSVAFNNTPIEKRYELFINIIHISFCRIAMLNIDVDNLEPIEIPTEGMKAIYYIQEAMQKENKPFKLATIYQISYGLKDKYPSLWELKLLLSKNESLKKQFLDQQYKKAITDIELGLNLNELALIKEKIRLAQG